MHFLVKEAKLGVDVLRLGHGAGLPAQRQVDGYIIDVLVGKGEVDRVYTVGMFEEMFFSSTENSRRDQNAPSRRCGPTRNFYFVLCDEGGGAVPVRLVAQLNLNRGGNVGSELVFKKLLAGSL